MNKKDYLTKLFCFAVFGLVFGNFVTNFVLLVNIVNPKF